MRCAIYTRKSTDEGLEQSFNSLDAQREACEAFIASQKHEGWILHDTSYDDGGWSGGTLERPAVQQLLEDIRLGRVQIIVVYKIDRLTRSLTDFAKLVEIFEAYLKLGSASKVKSYLQELGIRTPPREHRNGKTSGDKHFTTGHLY